VISSAAGRAPGARSSSSGMPTPADDLADTSIDVAQLVGDGRDRGSRAPGARASLFCQAGTRMF
jgi:hypothetical protein